MIKANEKLTTTTIKTEVRPVWVIKDSNNNFANANSIGKIEKNVMAYVSFKTFSPECRAYLTETQAHKALGKLQTKAETMELDSIFTLEYVELSNMIKESKAFQGENMVLVEMDVA